MQIQWCQNLGELKTLGGNSLEGKIACRVWLSSQPPVKARPIVFWVHGLGEHAGRYSEWARYLNGFGFDVVAPDLPGFGLSCLEGGCRRIPTVSECVEVVYRLLEFFVGTGGQFEGRTFHLGGHSMGGLIVLDYLRSSYAEAQKPLKALVTSAPLQLRIPVPAYKQKAVGLLQALSPDFAFPNGELSADQLSVDAANVAGYEQDRLVHGRVSSRWFFSMDEAAIRIRNQSFKIRTPIFIAVGEDDPIVSPQALESFSESLTSGVQKKFFKIPGAKHEVLFEINRDRLFRSFTSFIL